MGKKSRFGSGIKISDHISESLETIFWVKNTYIFFDGDPDLGFWIVFTLDPGVKLL
jgi:hypothetical protein